MNKKDKSGGLDKFSTGISGFDRLTRGGLPSRRTTLLLGGPGSGKTVFALQALVSAARSGQRGLFVSFNEPPRQLVENASGFGWNLEELEQQQLVLLDAQMRPSMVRCGHYDLTGLLAGLRAVATEMGARCVVFDSLDVLFTLLDERLSEVQEAFRLRDWLLENEFTGLITANLEASEPHAAQRRALLQGLADCSVELSYHPGERVARRSVRVTKYRGSGFLESEVPLAIGEAGLEVLVPDDAREPGAAASEPGLRPEFQQARQELSARVRELDRFLEMKQAELNFLLERQAKRGVDAGAGRARRPARRAAKV